MYSDLKYLLVELPEDIAKLKWCGDFERALRVIDLRLANDIPRALRRRLELEREILAALPGEYTHTREDALNILRETLKDFQDDELERLRDEDAMDWLYVDGELRFKDDFMANLIKTRPALEKRLKDPAGAEGKRSNFALLDRTIAEMKAAGKLAYRIHIKSTIKLDGDASRAGRKVRVHLPVPIAYAQVRNIKILGMNPEPAVLAPEDYPQRTVFFEAESAPGREFSVEYAYENHMDYIELKPERASDSQPTFYTEEQAPHVVFTPYIRDLAAEIVDSETNPVIKARRIYDFITQKVIYSFVRPYLAITNIPQYCATSLKGDCGLQALLFITLCRCAGIPARWQAGLYATPLSIGNHDWAQFYIAPYGWVYADCSFGGAAWRDGAQDRWNFYFGNLEPFRMPASSEFQHPFYPEKVFLRCDPYDNQSGEVEYEDGGLGHAHYSTTHQILEIARL